MADKTDDSLSPPYTPYGTLTNFIDTLSKRAVPDRIDRSIMPKMSGGAKKTLLSAMKFLKLVQPNGATTDLLRRAVKAFPHADQWKKMLAEILTAAYAPVVGKLPIGSASPKQLHDAFRENGGVEGQMLQKSVRFYLKAVKAAGLPLSPHLMVRNTAPTVKRSGGSGRERAKVGAGAEVKGGAPRHSPNPPGETAGEPLVKALLSKFPDFDPKWSPEQQTVWFDAYAKLLKMSSGGRDKND